MKVAPLPWRLGNPKSESGRREIVDATGEPVAWVGHSDQRVAEAIALQIILASRALFDVRRDDL
jgi:hypothetical protein